MNEEKIYLDQEGYKQYLKEIEDLKASLNKNSKEKSQSYVDAVGDGWHDNFAFEQLKREEFRIMSQLKAKLEGLARIVVVDSIESLDEVNICNFVLVDMGFSKENLSEKIVKLVGATTASSCEGYNEITLNSPLGKAIYKRPTGYEGSYSVNDRDIFVKIKKIGSTLEEIKEEEKTLKRHR